MLFGLDGFPWYRASLLIVAALSFVFALLFSPMLAQRKEIKEVPWITGLSLIFGVQALLIFYSSDLESFSLVHSIYTIRLVNLYAILFGLAKLVETFSGGTVRLFRMIEGVAIILEVWLLGFGATHLENLVGLSKVVLPWGETIASFQVERGAGFLLCEVGYLALIVLTGFHAVRFLVAHNWAKAITLVVYSLTLLWIFWFQVTNPLAKMGVSLIPHFSMILLIFIGLVVSRQALLAQKLALALAEKNKQVRNMTQHIPGVLYSFLVTPQGEHQFLYLSDNVKFIFGHEADDPDAFGIFARGMAPEDLARYQQSEQESIRTLTRWSFISQFTQQNGRVIWFQGISDPTATPQGTVFHGAIFDITERMNLVNERDALLSEVCVRKDELEAILGALSHDFRTPLVNIAGFTGEALEFVNHLPEGMTIPAVREEMLPPLLRIQDNSNRISKLVEGLLKVLRNQREELSLEPTDVQALFERATHYWSEPYGDIELEFSSALPVCKADDRQLYLVVSQLVKNAACYRHPQRPCKITVSGDLLETKAVYQITDNGIGFPEDQAERIFQVFFRATPENQSLGQGVGLSIAQQAMRRMGGTMRAEGHPNQGATFWLELPKGTPKTKN